MSITRATCGRVRGEAMTNERLHGSIAEVRAEVGLTPRCIASAIAASAARPSGRVHCTRPDRIPRKLVDELVEEQRTQGVVNPCQRGRMRADDGPLAICEG